MKNLYTQKVGTIFVFFFLTFLTLNSFAQVGIGTTNPDPNALLDLDATTTPGGLRIPRVKLKGLNNPFPLTGVVNEGMIVYNTVVAGFAPNNVVPGFYYSDTSPTNPGMHWQRIEGGPNTKWLLTGNTSTDPAINFVGNFDNVNLRFRTKNINRFEITNGTTAANGGRLRAFTGGTEEEPIYSWVDSPNSGMLSLGLDTLAFSTRKNIRMRILPSGKITINNKLAIDAAQLTVKSENSTFTGIYATSGSGTGVKGVATTSGSGVVGFSSTGSGIYGKSKELSGYGVYGSGYVGGVFRADTLMVGTGIIGLGNRLTTGNLASNGSGVAGNGINVGVYGNGGSPFGGVGVVGVGNGLTSYSVPVGGNGAGVAGTGTYIGVFGKANDINGYGIYSAGNSHTVGNITATGNINANSNMAGSGFAFSGGDLSILGAFSGHSATVVNLTVSGVKNFIIDDPRDPENKYLKHASIESNEILNIYRGVANFDAGGEVVVQLPDYYDLINKNASYQLTPIGASMPNLYIATEENNGTFKIAGGVPGKKVSWMLTAERNDPYIRNNPETRNMVVDKGVDRGRYLAPEEYGQTAEQGILNHRVNEGRIASFGSISKAEVGKNDVQSKITEAKDFGSEEMKSVSVLIRTKAIESSGANVMWNTSHIKSQDMQTAAEKMKLTESNLKLNTIDSSAGDKAPKTPK